MRKTIITLILSLGVQTFIVNKSSADEQWYQDPGLALGIATTVVGMLNDSANRSLSQISESESSNTGSSGTDSNAGSSNSATCVSHLFHKQMIEQVQKDAVEYQATNKESKSTLLMSVIQKTKELDASLDEDTIIKELLVLK